MHHRWQSGSRQVIENFLEIIIINWPPDDKGAAVWTGLQECLTDWPIYVSKATDNADVWSFCTLLSHSSILLLPGSINKWFLLTHSWHSSPIQCNASNAPSSTIMHGATQSQGASGPSEAWPITTQWHKSTKTGRAVDHPSSCTRTTQLFKQQPSV